MCNKQSDDIEIIILNKRRRVSKPGSLCYAVILYIFYIYNIYITYSIYKITMYNIYILYR